MHAIANDQRSAGLGGGAKEDRNVLRPMLAVTIQGHYPRMLLRQRNRYSCAECGALAWVSIPPYNLRSRGGGSRSRLVPRTVVHHNDRRQVPPDLMDQPR